MTGRAPSPSQPTDEPSPQFQTRELVGMAQDGDRRAINDLLDRYLPRILRVVRMKSGAFLRQRLDDQDLTQEVMIRVWRSLPQYDDRQTASFLMWVTRIADNAMRDLARRQLAARRNPGAMLSMDEDSEGTDDSTHPVSSTTPSRVLHRAEHGEIVDQAVRSLDEKTRNLIVMRFYLGLSHEEIGSSYELGAEAVRSRIRRAVDRLKSEFELRGLDGAAYPEKILRQAIRF